MISNPVEITNIDITGCINCDMGEVEDSMALMSMDIFERSNKAMVRVGDLNNVGISIKIKHGDTDSNENRVVQSG